MAQKMAKYEDTASIEIKENEGLSLDFDGTDLFARIEILSRYSTQVALAAEESYGYLPLDLVRDKDGMHPLLQLPNYLPSLPPRIQMPLNI